MSEGPLFPKKSDAPDAKNETPDSPPVQIERSDDPDFGQATSQTSGSTQSGSPNVPSRRVGCGSSVFVLMLVGIALVVAGRVLL
jgi:hypothetical protein